MRRPLGRADVSVRYRSRARAGASTPGQLRGQVGPHPPAHLGALPQPSGRRALARQCPGASPNTKIK
ncbi:MAG: hypothetical protein MUC97_07385 [Bernardetiaceae bacterium]|nr:hypothetical protein [Bernardetiaceae bacterium]